MKSRKYVKLTKFNNIKCKNKLLLYFMLFCMSVSLVGCGDLTKEESKKSQSSKTIITENYDNKAKNNETENQTKVKSELVINLSEIPKFDEQPYIALDNNKPNFSESEITEESFESYSTLDSMGRCGVALACVGKDIMPTEKRSGIGMIKPTGWHTVKYQFVDGKYLYNRCHLIGYQLTGENANERNLITGTRYMNVDGMLPFENMITDYVKETNHHVMYRVTPIYKGNNLVASGVQMEGYSVEDSGKGISFNVYCYNAQPGVTIDYKTGESSVDGKMVQETTKKNVVEKKDNSSSSSGSTQYILNLSSHKFHYPDCGSVKFMSESNKGTYTGSREDLIAQGYEPCGNCNP